MEAVLEETLKDNEFKFVRGNYLIMPYIPDDPNLVETTLYGLWVRLHKEGLWETVFHENPGMKLMDFMEFFSNRRKSFLNILTLVDGENIVDCCGMAWLSDMRVCHPDLFKAVGSFVYFKDYQKPAYTTTFAEFMLEYWFEQVGLNTLVGMTPVGNRAAMVYVKRIGMKEMCQIPNYTVFDGEVCAAMISTLTKDDYLRRRTNG